MSTSTPRVNAKLYGYLKGYNICCYTGSDAKFVIDSIHQLTSDEFKGYFPELVYPEERMHKILSNVDKFLIKYYNRMRNIKTYAKVKTLADNSKDDKKTLDRLLSHLVSTDNCTLSIAAFMALSKNGEPVDICEKCPWYLSHKFCMIYVTEESDEAITAIYQFKVAEYKYLALAILEMANLLVTYCGIDIANLSHYYTMFTDMLTCAHIFELMNPEKEVKEQYIADTLELLKAPGIRHDTPQYQEYDKLFSAVCRDIEEGRKPYIKEIAKAISKFRKYESDSQFDESVDFYYSMKGTGQSGFTREKISLQSSAFEVDIHKEDQRVKEFDDLIGYHSYYKPNDSLADIVSIRTIAINNPAKFKPRIIHIADNAIQDRCNWIHRRLMNLLKWIPSDCTRNQDKGRVFLQRLTWKWSHQVDPNKKIGIYCTDFSNATDTIDQGFTHQVLEYVFRSSKIANFWDYVSTLDKEICHVDGTKEIYPQYSGQPQGLLASFPLFALCHHFLFLMDMKELGMESIPASQYYAVLGDDAVYNTVDPEIDFMDGEDPFQDSAGIDRSLMEMVHFRKCQHYAGLIVNFDKSESAHHWSDEAKLDFAKVTYRNGDLFSPIPFRLAMKYSRSFDDKLATLIWRVDRGDKLANQLLDNLIDTLPENRKEIYRNIIRCGELPFLDGFKDNREYPSTFVNKLRYALAISMLTAGLSWTILSDGLRSKVSYDIYDRAMSTVFTKQQQLRLDKIHPEHKVMQLIYANSEIIQNLHEIYSKNDFDDQFMAMCLGSLVGDQKEEMLWMIYDLASFHRDLREALSSPDVDRERLSSDFPELRPYREIRRDLNIISNRFLTRGLTKRPGECSYLFRKTFEVLETLDEVLNDESLNIDCITAQ